MLNGYESEAAWQVLGEKGSGELEDDVRYVLGESVKRLNEINL